MQWLWAWMIFDRGCCLRYYFSSKLRIFFLFIGLFFSGAVWPASFDLNLRSDAVRVIYAFAIDKKAVVDAGGLLGKKDKQDDEVLIFHSGIHWLFEPIRIGVRALYVTPDGRDTLSLGFGGQARFPLARRVSLAGHFYYAPEVTSMLDSKNYREVAIRVNYKLARTAYVYVGYRNLKVSVLNINNTVELDEGLLVGAKFYF